jgi:hypothetical protein
MTKEFTPQEAVNAAPEGPTILQFVETAQRTSQQRSVYRMVVSNVSA